MVHDNIIQEHARIGFKNFAGKEGKYNPAGRKNFCLFIDDQKFAQKLQEDGWNVRWLQPREIGDEPQAYLQVSVSFDNIPPKVVLVSKKGQSLLDAESINMLDWAEISNWDVVIRPYNWELNGKTGVKAYLKEMWATIVEDEFADKYTNAPTVAADAIGGCGACEVCDGSCGDVNRTL